MTAQTQAVGVLEVLRSLSGSLVAASDLTAVLLIGPETWVELSGSLHVTTSLAAALRIVRPPTGRAAVLEAMALTDAEAVLGEMLTEPAVYESQGGSMRSVQVVVDRQTPHLASLPRRTVRPLRIWAKNAGDGIAAAEVRKGDVVRLARHFGAEPVAMHVIRRVGQTDGWCELEVQ